MPAIWTETEQASPGWAVARLDGFSKLVLSEDATRPIQRWREEMDGAWPILFRREDSEEWLLLTSDVLAVYVNSMPLRLGLHVLQDRDEIRIGGRRFFFSAESLARVVPFPGSDRVLLCARCRQQIADGTPAVGCPSSHCGAWHHQTDELPCWTYGATCTLCDQPTALEAGYRWTPMDL